MTIGCGVSVSSPQILSFPLPASLKKGGMVMAVSPWYSVAWKTLFNVRNNFHEKDLCFLSLSNSNCRVSSFCRHDPSEFGLVFVKVFQKVPLCSVQREIMLFIGKPMGRSIMISNATNPLKESRKESLLRCAGSTSICVWLICDLDVMCVQAIGDRALGDLCVCVRCGSVQSQKV